MRTTAILGTILATCLLASSCAPRWAAIDPPPGGFVPTQGGQVLPLACAARWGTPGLPPPGCATALNLAEKAEAASDLVAPRPLAPALALPVARAAETYLEKGGAETLPPAGAAPLFVIPR